MYLIEFICNVIMYLIDLHGQVTSTVGIYYRLLTYCNCTTVFRYFTDTPIVLFLCWFFETCAFYNPCYSLILNQYITYCQFFLRSSPRPNKDAFISSIQTVCRANMNFCVTRLPNLGTS